MKRPFPKRPLRTVFLGDLRYCSAYRLGVGQAVMLLGGLHRDVSIRDDVAAIDRQVREMAPDLIFTHMLLWPPHTTDGAQSVGALLDLAASWRRAGSIVLVHDGDPRSEPRYPHDVSASVDAALVNYDRDVPEWKIPVVRWPYGAFAQAHIGEPNPTWRADLVFAGLMREGDDLYGPRTACVRALVACKGLRVYPDPWSVSNRLQIAEVAPSCIAMIGFGRPEVPGWIDTRVFSVPGAGGILIHDDVGDSGLVDREHFVSCKRYDVDSILEAFAYARENQDRLRRAGFAFVQARHTWGHRLQAVLDLFYGAT